MYYIQAEFKGKLLKYDSNYCKTFADIADVKSYLQTVASQHNLHNGYLIFIGAKITKKLISPTVSKLNKYSYDIATGKLYNGKRDGGYVITKTKGIVQVTNEFESETTPKTLKDLRNVDGINNKEYIWYCVEHDQYDIVDKVDKRGITDLIAAIEFKASNLNKWYNLIIQHRNINEYNIFKFSNCSNQFVDDNFDIYYKQLFNFNCTHNNRYLIENIIAYRFLDPTIQYFISLLSEDDGKKFIEGYKDYIRPVSKYEVSSINANIPFMLVIVIHTITAIMYEKNMRNYITKYPFYRGVCKNITNVYDIELVRDYTNKVVERDISYGRKIDDITTIQLMDFFKNTPMYSIIKDVAHKLTDSLAFNDNIVDDLMDLFS